MGNKDDKEYKAVMDLLAEKIKIKEDFSNINGLFRELFSIEYSSLWDEDKKDTATSETKVFIKLKKEKKFTICPLMDLMVIFMMENTVCHWNATIRRRC